MNKRPKLHERIRGVLALSPMTATDLTRSLSVNRSAVYRALEDLAYAGVISCRGYQRKSAPGRSPAVWSLLP